MGVGELRWRKRRVNIVATNGATLALTGVKLEIGSVATPFNRQSLAKSMADCQRYYQKLGGIGGRYLADGIRQRKYLLLSP